MNSLKAIWSGYRSHVAAVLFLGIMPIQCAYTSELDWSEDYAFDPNEKVQRAHSAYGYGDFRISFECLQGNLRFKVQHKTFLGLHNSSVDLTLVADDKPPFSTTVYVRPHNDKEAVSLMDEKSIAEYLMGAERLIVNVYPKYQNAFGNGFSMAGSDYTIYRVFEVCDDPLSISKPQRPSALGPRLTSPEQAQRLYEERAALKDRAREEEVKKQIGEKLRGLFD